MYTLSPHTIKKADREASEKYGTCELTLMKNAANACADYIKNLISKESKIAILCGKGNNGGDGYAISSILKNEGYEVFAVNVFDSEPNTKTARTVYEQAKEDLVNILPYDDGVEALKSCDVIIDAIFGVGFYGKIDNESKVGEIISLCNKSGALKIAVDVPSGINSDDGRVEGEAFCAHYTFTMAYCKTGMLSYPAFAFCGNVKIADIGYPKELCESIEKSALVADDEYIKIKLLKREKNTHKGSFGRLLMYCASENMTGAGILAAKGALRAGVGLLNIARDDKTIKVLQNHLVEPVFSVLSAENEKDELLTLATKATAILVGCGMGSAKKDKDTLFHLIKNANCPIIIDADGINAICENKMILREAKKTPVITPHPLEFARLLDMSASDVQKNRINLARDFAKENGCIVVLKGANTVIASPCGKLAINTSGNPGLAKAGSGDVLSGILASFVAQGIDVFDSVVLAVYLHGKAGDMLRDEISEYGFLPSDLPIAVAKLLP